MSQHAGCAVAAAREEDGVDSGIGDELAIARGPLLVAPGEERLPPAEVGRLDDAIAPGPQNREARLETGLVDRPRDRRDPDRRPGSKSRGLNQGMSP